MKRIQMTPMRTTVGDPIPLMSEAVSVRGVFANSIKISQYKYFGEVQLPYNILIPSELGLSTSTTQYQRGNGVDTYPSPADLPFEFDPIFPIPFLSLAGVGNAVDENISRQLWFELKIDIGQSIELFNNDLGEYVKHPDATEQPVIGGICFGGYPFVPYYITEEGGNSANFGLPREIRVTWQGQSNDGFLDAHNSITVQSPAAHSGVHIITTGPIKTDKLTIRFSDLPRFLIRIPRNGSPVEQWGCAIPFLYLLEYRENTRYQPDVPAALVASTHMPGRREHTYTSVIDAQASEKAKEAVTGITADFLLTTGVPLQYFPLSAASLFGQRRNYPIDVNGGVELFWSQDMVGGNRLRLIVEQTGENNRCLAGLRLLYPKSRQGEEARFEIRIYELDPIGGVSPASIKTDIQDDKYATLLFRHRNAPSWHQRDLVCEFVKPTTARYLAIDFSLRSDKGRVVLAGIELIQSAHVVVVPRKSRTQQIQALNFRLIGPDLAADYARIGPDAFSFVVEHMVAGEPSATLFEAKSLFDLARHNGVRILANQRYEETIRDTTREVATTSEDSFERKRTEIRSNGWRRSETGKGTKWEHDENRELYATPPDDSFGAGQSGETRVRTEHLGFQSIVQDLRDFIESIGKVFVDDWTIEEYAPMLVDDDGLFSTDTNIDALIQGEEWKTLWESLLSTNDNDISELLKVDGLKNYSVPPYLFVEEYAQLLTKFKNPLSLSPVDFIDLFQATPLLGAILTLQGFSIGLNGGGSYSSPPFSGNAGLSISSSAPLPIAARTSTTGTTGTITRQASKQGKSYAQYLDNGYNDSVSHVHYVGGHLADDTDVAARTTRTIVRDVDIDKRVRQRNKGVTVHWQGVAQDIVTGSIPLNLVLPATADKVYRTTDQAIRVRFPNGLGDLQVDVWFDMREEVLRDDH